MDKIDRLALEKEYLRELLRSRSAYDKCLENTIHQAAQLKIIIDELYEDVIENGAIVRTGKENMVRSNPSAELLSKFMKDYQKSLGELGLTNRALVLGKATNVDKLEELDATMKELDGYSI